MSPTALSFLLQEKGQGRKECLDAFGASCRADRVVRPYEIREAIEAFP